MEEMEVSDCLFLLCIDVHFANSSVGGDYGGGGDDGGGGDGGGGDGGGGD